MKNRKTRWIAAGGIITAAVLISLALGEHLREAIVGPLLYFLWVASVFINRSPQAIFWIVFVSAGVLVAAHSLATGREQRQYEQEPAQASPGRVLTLARWIQEAPYGIYFRQRISRQMLKLTLESRGYYDRLNLMQITALLEGREFDLPSDVAAYLKGGTALYQDELDGMSTPSVRLRLWLSRVFNAPGKQPGYHDAGLEYLIEILENDLEIHHDTTTQ
jgi:hypothetical protein